MAEARPCAAKPASQPPESVRLLSRDTTSFPEGAVYVPSATRTASPAAARPTAPPMVRHGAAAVWQSEASSPRGATYHVADRAGAPADRESTKAVRASAAC